MDSPMISVVTPSFNQRRYIGATIESVKQSEYEHVEHVVVDGGSTDGTVDLLEEYESEYNLRWVSEPDEGQSHAINKGIEMARGNWIGWQNSDDFYLDGCFTTVADVIEREGRPDVVYGDVLQVDERGETIRKRYKTEPSRIAHRYGRSFAQNQSCFFRRDVFESIGTLDEDLEYVMDAELFWRLLESDHRLVHVPEFLGARRLHGEAKMVNADNERYRRERHELERLYGYSPLEEAAPHLLLSLTALLVQLTSFVLTGRFEAARYTAVDVVRRNMLSGGYAGGTEDR